MNPGGHGPSRPPDCLQASRILRPTPANRQETNESEPSFPMQPVLTLYSRFHCHLCQDMQRLLGERQALLGFRFEVVDIDADAGLAAR